MYIYVYHSNNLSAISKQVFGQLTVQIVRFCRQKLTLKREMHPDVKDRNLQS